MLARNMDIIKLLPEYLDTGVDTEELVAITQAALAQRIRSTKLAIAQAVVQARACTLLDNLEGSHQALHHARHLQKEYHHFLAEWQRLQHAPQQDSPGADHSNTAVPATLSPNGLESKPGANP